MPDERSNSGSENDPVAQLLAQFQDAKNAGDNPDPAQYLARCPHERREELRQAISFSEQFASPTLRPPSRFGDFEILQEIGRGGMGVVYEAKQLSLNRRVALKVLAPWVAGLQSAIERFHREAQAVAKLKHPHIVQIYSIGSQDGIAYIAMELAHGRGLDELLREAQEQGETLPLAKVIAWCGQISRALACAHEAGIVHRDIKPSNIRITPEGKALLLDFGLARDEQASSMTRTGHFQGTPYYCSPEQVAARRIQIDARTDVYSLGVTLYQCVTGRVPFEGDTTEQVFNQILMKEPAPPRKLNVQVSRDLEAVIQKAMDKDRDLRFQSAQEFAQDLEALLEFRAVRARVLGFWGRHWKRFKRDIKQQKIAGTIGAVLAITVINHYWKVIEERQEISRELQEARHHKEIGDLDKARDLTERIIAKNSLHAEALSIRQSIKDAVRDEEEKKLREERDEKEKALVSEKSARRRADGLRLSSQAMIANEHNPTLALLLAIEGAMRHPSDVANLSLLSALAKCFEEKHIQPWDPKWGENLGYPIKNSILGGNTKAALSSFSFGGILIWDIETGLPIQSRYEHKTLPGYAPVISAKGSAALIPTRDQKLILKSPQFGIVRQLQEDDEKFDFIFGTFSNDEKLAFASSWDKGFAVWEVNTGQKIVAKTDFPWAIGQALFDPSGEYILLSSIILERDHKATLRGRTTLDTWSIALLNVRTKNIVFAEDFPERRYFSVSATFSKDGKSIAILADDKILIFDARNGRRRDFFIPREPTGKSLLHPSGKIDDAVTFFDNDSQLLFLTELTSGQFEVTSLHVEDGSVQSFIFPTTSYPRLIRLSPDQKYICVIGDEISVFDLQTKKQIFAASTDASFVYSSEFSADSKWMITASTGGICRIWSLEQRGITRFKTGDAEIKRFCFTENSDTIVTMGADIKFWREGKLLSTCHFPSPHPEFSEVAVSSNGEYVAASFGINPHIAVWKRTGDFLGLFHGGPTDYLSYSHEFSKDSTRLLVSYHSGNTRVWNVEKNEMLSEINTENQTKGRAIFTPDGNRILREISDGRLAFYSTDNWEKVSEIQIPKRAWSKESRLACSKTGNLIAVSIPALPQEGCRIIESHSGKTIAHLPLNGIEIEKLEFSHNENFLLTFETNGSAKIWNAMTGTPYLNLPQIDERMLWASFSPEGNKVVSCHVGGVLRFWPLDPLTEALKRKPRDLTPEEKKRYEIVDFEKD